MRILLLIPPMTQINTYYPSTSYLCGHLRGLGYHAEQDDLSLKLFLKLFSSSGLRNIQAALQAKPSAAAPKVRSPHRLSDASLFFLDAAEDYISTIDPVVRFLQGRDPSLSLRLAERLLVPEGPRFQHINAHPQILKSFGTMGTQDRAKYIASLYIDDLADVIKHDIDPLFELSRYGERLAESKPDFSPLHNILQTQNTLVDQTLAGLVASTLAKHQPHLVGLTVPFPGNLYGALRIAQHIRKFSPQTHITMGGGYVNTELRRLSDPRIFAYIDSLTYDDGELPLTQLLLTLQKKRKLAASPTVETSAAANPTAATGAKLTPQDDLVRTLFLYEGKCHFTSNEKRNLPFKESATPVLDGLPLNDYVSMIELPNPMYRLWTDHRWNKLIVAHGCYWKRCTFCDTHLDYIQRYEPHKIETLIEQMTNLAKQSGTTGFHFVDEALPPALLRSLSEKLIERKLKFTWWGNLRFDKQFDRELCELMADAGCVAVTGGLEVASPRLLKLINKGVTIEQVRKVTKSFSGAGIYVHAYLMYGFPSQTKKETLDSLKVVERLFADGCIHSAHWHRFVCTAHSPVGRNPEQFGIQLWPHPTPPHGLFAEYEIPFIDSVKTDHEKLGHKLRKATYNWMHF